MNRDRVPSDIRTGTMLHSRSAPFFCRLAFRFGLQGLWFSRWEPVLVLVLCRLGLHWWVRERRFRDQFPHLYHCVLCGCSQEFGAPGQCL